MQFGSIVLERASETPIGLIRIKNVDNSDGHATIEMFMLEKYRAKRHGFDAFCLLVDYLTEALNLRKVYVATYGGFDYLRLGRWSDFIQEEARFPEHFLFRGTLIELRLSAVYAERWRELRKLVWTDVQGDSPP
jgi:RimJ/RimL family protein N-acetyltransferase